MADVKVLLDDLKIEGNKVTFPQSGDLNDIFNDAADGIDTDFGKISKDLISIDATGQVVINDADAAKRIAELQKTPGVSELNIGQCVVGVGC